MRRVGLAAVVAAITVAALETDASDEATVEETAGDAEFAPLPEITADPVTEEQVSEPKKPKRGKKEVTNEQDSDG